MIIRQAKSILDYSQVYEKMLAFTLAREADTCDEIWLLQHNPVLTLGRKASTSHILHKDKIPIIQTDRGGEVTYHAPGQLVVYFLLDLNRMTFDIAKLLNSIEMLVIKTLASYKIKSFLRQDAPGVYVNLQDIFINSALESHSLPNSNGACGDFSSTKQVVSSQSQKPAKQDLIDFFGQAKIASLGLRVHKGCTYHGLSFNIKMDMTGFSYINPCGFAGIKMTQLHDFLPVDLMQVSQTLISHIPDAFDQVWTDIKKSKF